MKNINYGGGMGSIPVNEAARIMGKSPQFIRIGLQRGLLPFGVAFKTDERNEQYDYYISPKKFSEFTGYDFKNETFYEDSIISDNYLTEVNEREDEEYER